MNLRTYKPLLALAALAFGLAACNSEELDTGTSSHGDGQLTITAADTRSVAEDANISVKIGTTTHAYTLKADGTLTPPTTKPLIEPGTKTLDIHAWGTVKWDLDGNSNTEGDRTDMYVIHQNAATPVAWSATGPSVELRLAAATALIRLNVTDSDGENITNGTTMPGAKIAAWDADNPGTLVEGSGASFTATGLLQIMPGITIAAGEKLFAVGTKILYAMKSYSFAAGTEYTFNVRITTKGEAILEGFTIKGIAKGDPLGNVMYINSIEDLRTFRNRVNLGEYSLNAIQTTDIVMEDEDKAGEGWEPIGDYAGTYNGGGYSISGLTINTNQGLFGYIASDATLTAIRLKDVNVVGGDFTGALVGDNQGTISKCSVEGGSVSGSSYTGGLVGRNGGTLVSCFSTASVTAANGIRVGGLVGENSAGTIAFCYAMGNVESSGIVGGLVGIIYSGTITSCYATGKVTPTGSNIGSLLGNFSGGAITYCHAPLTDGITHLVGDYEGTGASTPATCSIADGEAGNIVRGGSVTIDGTTHSGSDFWEENVAVPRLKWQIATP